MQSVDLPTKTSIPIPPIAIPAGTTSLTFSLSTAFPALAQGAVAAREFRPDGTSSALARADEIDTDPNTPRKNSASWLIDPKNKYLVRFRGDAFLFQTGGTISLTAVISDQNGTMLASLSNSGAPATEDCDVNIRFDLG